MTSDERAAFSRLNLGLITVTERLDGIRAAVVRLVGETEEAVPSSDPLAALGDAMRTLDDPHESGRADSPQFIPSAPSQPQRERQENTRRIEALLTFLLVVNAIGVLAAGAIAARMWGF